MHRRSYLAGSVAAIASISGCTGILDDSGDGSEDPAAVARSFVAALFAGDAETVNGYLHDESAIDPVDESDLDGFRERDLRVDGTNVVSRGDGEAIVEVTTSGEIAMTAPGESATVRVLLRKQGGEWRVMTVGTPSFGDGGPSAPSVQWDSTTRTNDDGAVTDVVFTHAGGDTVKFGRLSVAVGDSFAGPATTGDVVTGSRVVASFGGDGDPIDAGTDVELRWTNPGTGDVQTLAVHRVTSTTAGSLGDQIRLEN